MNTGQQLYAKIKKSSKYYDQNNIAKRDASWGGFPFQVRIVPNDPMGGPVKGGPGGQYRLSDVNLFIVENGHEVRIS